MGDVRDLGGPACLQSSLGSAASSEGWSAFLMPMSLGALHTERSRAWDCGDCCLHGSLERSVQLFTLFLLPPVRSLARVVYPPLPSEMIINGILFTFSEPLVFPLSFWLFLFCQVLFHVFCLLALDLQSGLSPSHVLLFYPYHIISHTLFFEFAQTGAN